jgi:hypothetical protein
LWSRSISASAQRPSPADLARLVAVAVPLIVAPQWAIAFGEQRFEPYEHVGWAWRLLVSLPLAVVLMAAVGRLAWSLFARSSTRGTSTFVLVCAMPPLAFQVVSYANVAADREVGRPVVVDCVGYIHRAKGPSLVELTSWADPTRTVTLRNFVVNEADCAAHRPIRIVVHSGRLGAEWISTSR